MKCISNPSKKVYGYVVVSNVITQRMFIYASDFTQFGPEYSNCHPGYGYEQNNADGLSQWKGWWWAEVKDPDVRSVILDDKEIKQWNYNTTLDGSSILYPKECVDCRTYHRATKKRPDFWPTDHE